MLCIVDINIGNTGSVAKALRHLGYEFRLTQNPTEIRKATKIIFPGVGSFSTAANALKTKNLTNLLREKGLVEKTPILGICVGMQMLASIGSENGKSEGLDLIDAEIVKLRVDREKYRIPHVGWNDVSIDNSPLYTGIDNGSCFYFVHSYEMLLNSPISHATTDYEHPVIASVSHKNIHGVQFHPEKSQDAGLQLLRNFVELC